MIMIVFLIGIIYLAACEFKGERVVGTFEVTYDPETMKIRSEVWGLYYHGVKFSPDFPGYSEMKEWASKEGIDFEYEHYGHEKEAN